MLVALLGIHVYMTRTAKRLHTEPQNVQSVMHADPSRKWADAVERGRQSLRASLTEQNLPGLSVAVGAGGDIVWAEGFGWADLENRVPVAPGARFRIGTASKALTSAAVGLLLEKGRLKLDSANPRYGLHLMRPINYSCYAGASVFLSTPSDLARFGMAINSGKLLKPATVELLQTSQRLPSGQETGYGLGWDLETVALAGQQSNISYADTAAIALKIADAFRESVQQVIISRSGGLIRVDRLRQQGRS
jgi:CubicO group peptidase (beta-lactamase class C family)